MQCESFLGILVSNKSEIPYENNIIYCIGDISPNFDVCFTKSFVFQCQRSGQNRNSGGWWGFVTNTGEWSQLAWIDKYCHIML